MEMGRALHEVLNGALRGRRGKALVAFLDAVAWDSWSHEPEVMLHDNRAMLQSLVEVAMSSEGWRALEGGEVMAELPLALFERDGAEPFLLEGVLDAVSISESGAVIVDWKSATSAERFAKLRAGYEEQGAMYADIVARRTGLDTRVVIQPVRS
jgi:ATP-dependent exoDNAse (exonuclease V) beta subunit